MMFGQHLSHKRRPEIRIMFFDDGQRVIAFGRVDLVVRRAPARLVPDRGCAIPAVPLQQPENLPPCQCQHVRRVVHAQPTIIDLRQNFHAVQLALAHHHPSHVRSSSHRYAKRVTLLLCPWVTLSLCGHNFSRISKIMVKLYHQTLPFADSSTAMGYVAFSSASTRTRLTVRGTAKSAPGRPQSVLQNARARSTTKGLRLKVRPIMRGSRMKATKTCAVVSVTSTAPAIDSVPNCARLSSTGKMTPISEPI